MAVTSGFFNSLNGDRRYNAEQMSNYFEGLISDGVYESVGERFAVTLGTGLHVTVGTGRAVIQSHWVKNDSALTLSIDPADVQYNRSDAIVLRLDKREYGRQITVEVKKGTPSASFELPPITRTNDVYELYIARVDIAKNSPVISVVDLRPSSYCGWVTGIIKQVDTSDLFRQWQEAYEAQFEQFNSFMAQKTTEFNQWFSNLRDQLTVDTTITKYQNIVTVSGSTNEVAIGIDDYNPDMDVLFVFVRGVFFAESLDYVQIKIAGENGIKTTTTALKQGDKVCFVVLKSVIGGNVVSPRIASIRGNVVDAAIVGDAEFTEV